MSNNITLGFEFEIYNLELETIEHAVSQSGLNCLNAGYTHENNTVWKAVRDGSCGSELVSRVLTRGDFTEIRTALKAVKSVGAKIDRRCGLHVHIGAHTADCLNTHLQNENGFVEEGCEWFITNLDGLYRNWFSVQSAINGLTSPSRYGNRFTQHLSEQVVERRIRYGLLNWVERTNWREAGDDERYASLNILPLKKYATVEFRQHQGTLNDAKAIAWSDFCLAFILASNAGEDFRTLPIRQYTNRRDELSTAEARLLVYFLMEKGYLPQSAGNWLLTNKMGQ